MSAVQWWPADFMDEVMPPGREGADDWIVAHADGFAIDAADPGNESNYYGKPQPLQDGEIVNFVTCTDYGTATLTLEAAGQWNVDVPMPDEAEQCCIVGDSDTLGGSEEETATVMIERDDELGEYPIGYYTYSQLIPLRFEQATRSFVAPGRTQ